MAAAKGSRLARGCGWLAGACAGRPLLVVLLALLLAGYAGQGVVRHFALNTNTDALFPQSLPWRVIERSMAVAFPQRENLIAIVIDAPSGAIAEAVASDLAAALSGRTDLFFSVRRPDALPYFRRNGLLFLDEAEVAETVERIIEAQPLLGTIAADPSLRGVATAFGLVLQGVERGEATLELVAAPLQALAVAAEAAAAGRAEAPDWGTLFTGRAPNPLELRRFILVQPQLDFMALSPGASATAAIRQALALPLALEPGVRIRVTGEIPMGDDEFASIADGALTNTLLSLGLVSLWLWLALRSLRLILPVLAVLLLGLLFTAAFGALVIGPFNPLSIAFAVLFIGLGVDFGIQYAMRYRACRQEAGGLLPALVMAGTTAGPGIVLAGLATSGGFLAFLPTEYRGVSELGAIAGVGMLVAALLALTVLPALLRLTQPRAEAEEVGWPALAVPERWMAARARPLTRGLAVLALACVATLPWLPFDFNPLNLRDPKSEAVATFRDLMDAADTTPNTLNVMAPSQPAARAEAARLERLPTVARALTLESLIPEDQGPKLAVIQDAAELLGPTLYPAELAPAPTDEEVATALAELAAGMARQAASPDAQRLAVALGRLDRNGRANFARALLPGLAIVLNQLNDALKAAPVSLETLPRELAEDWISADGRARIELTPRDLSESRMALRVFAEEVQAEAPMAGGLSISIQSSAATIREAFIKAGVLALVWTAVLLLATLRSLRLSLLALAPLGLAGLATLAVCTLVGPTLNLANIIALPLLFGIGVAFDIYYVVAWRDGERSILPTPLTRAVLFSALTTASAFGTLALSTHPGTASMGLLLAISLVMSLAAVLLVLPVLLHRFGVPRPAAE